MKNVIVLLLITVSTSCFGQTFKSEIYTVVDVSGGKPMTVAAFFGTHVSEKRPHLALNTFFSINHKFGWGEALVGPSYVRPNFEAGIMAGMESDDRFWRVSPWFWAQSKNGKLSILGVYEYGASGWWFNVEPKFRVTRKASKTKVQLGGIARRFHGVGPRADISKGKIYVWVSPIAWDWETKAKNTMLGIGAQF